jgi:hypothetical protein
LALILLLSISCVGVNPGSGNGAEEGDIEEPNQLQVEPTQAQTPASAWPTQPTTETAWPVTSVPGALLQPGNLEYQGAFHLPDSPQDELSRKYSGESMTYYPDGDPNGPQDGFPGSLFAARHDW